MEIKFADTFGKSINRLIMQQTWWYKTYEFFRYDTPRFFKNIWLFRKVLWNYRWWDYRYSLEAFRTSLEIMEKGMHGGLEVFESRHKKIQKMQRVIQLIKNVEEDNYIAAAEAELGEIFRHDWEFEDAPDLPGYFQLVDKNTEEENAHNRKVYDRADEIEKEEWDELFTILKGGDYKAYHATLTEEEKMNRDSYDNWFDGSGLKGWWD